MQRLQYQNPLFMKYLKHITLAAVVALFSRNASASHLVAGDISYTHVSGNNYLITLTLFRDCQGVIMSPPTLMLNSTCHTYATSMNLVTGGEVNTYCSLPTHCNGGSLFGYEYYIYNVSATLTPCSDWKIYYEECCRNFTGINVASPAGQSFRIEATLDNSMQNNNSPIFNHQPALFSVIGEPICINNTAFDTDGDSLVYELIASKGNGGAPLTYLSGFTPAAPVGITVGTTFNTANGNFCAPVYPFNPGGYIVAVKISEFRNGVLIGSTIRDMQILMFNQMNSAQIDVHGTVTDAIGNPQAGVSVELYEYSIAEGTMPLNSTFISNALGQFEFNGVDRRQYMLKAATAIAGYLPTYYESTYYWNYGQIAYSFCDTVLTKNIELVPVVNPMGTGIISGYLNGYGLRQLDLLANVYVYLIDDAGQLVGHAITDANGYYAINNVADGSYSIIVDITGLAMQSTHQPTVAAGNSIADQDFLANVDGIYAVNFAGTSNIISLNAPAFTVYPNPGNNLLNIDFAAQTPYTVELFSVTGHKVLVKEQQNNLATINVQHLSTGTYFVRITQGDSQFMVKWFKF